MIRQFSAGAIVFKEGKVLLIKNKSIKDERSSTAYKKISFWGFPKGHIGKGESSKTAALRELKEETGIEAKIVSKIGDSKYFFTQNGERIFKIVIVYLMEYKNGKEKPQLSEIDEVVWIDPIEALKKLTFKNDKILLQNSLEILQKEGTKTLQYS